jgi:anthranilate synthase component I
LQSFVESFALSQALVSSSFSSSLVFKNESWAAACWLSDTEPPVARFYRMAKEADCAALLESVEQDSRLARFSILAVAPWLTLTHHQGCSRLAPAWPAVTPEASNSGEAQDNPLFTMKHWTEKLRPSQAMPKALSHLPFAGGWLGYLGYGVTQDFEEIPQQAKRPQEVPDAFYGYYCVVWVYDHLKRMLYGLAHRPQGMATPLWETTCKALAEGALPQEALKVNDVTDETLPLFKMPMEGLRPLGRGEAFSPWQTSFTREGFMASVLEAKELIRQGEVFQIVLSQRFFKPFKAKPLEAYRLLQTINPSPYAYYLKCPNFAYLGASPETFVSCQQGEVMLKALAGTRPRGATEAEDQALELALINDPKELAEHRMLVDLGRNDLGRICKVGSLRVGKVAQVTHYSHVMHLTTELKGQLAEGKTAFDVAASCFPRGTVSGAPKIRAMQHLAKLEPEQRGLYSGAVGYFDLNGNGDAAIAIRSVLLKDGVAHVQAGAGVVYDSDPEMEYEETRNKAFGVISALNWAETLAASAANGLADSEDLA